ncbi:MAG: electron transporter RnfD [Oscillospiraceae bacterium]|nr:electron transporter RnfD [Oscillospiraceae bacterium]
MKTVKPSDKRLQYMGRIDFSDPDAPDFFWAGSLVQFAFTGDTLVFIIENHISYNGLQLGCIIDGKEHTVALGDADNRYDIPVSGWGTHKCILFKRQDSTHHFVLREILLSDDGDLCKLPPLPRLKLECYGDSVTAGSVVEAVHCVGTSDPPVYDSVYDNAWHSYAMQTARLLNAQVHLVAQGGIALFDHTGYFDNGNYGMETAYDKLCYFPDFPMTKWDFSRYQPDYVTFAIGQNDQHFDGRDQILDAEQRERWLETYCRILADLMQKYPKAVFILMLTVLMHDEFWEELLDDACERMSSPRVKRFRFTRSGKATPGHPRIPEQCEMACELTEYINSLRTR